MKKASTNTMIVLSVLIFVLAAIFLSSPKGTPASQMNPEELITYTLESLDVAGAVPDTEEMARQEKASGETELSYLVYQDSADQTRYFFQENSGMLSMIWYESPGKDNAVWDSEADPSEEEREALALAYAEKLLQPYQIGALQLDHFQSCWHLSNEERTLHRTAYRYIYKEYLDGLPTGTSVEVEIWAQGNVDSATLWVGEIFHPNLFGVYSPKNGTDFIPEEQAEELGFQEVSNEYSDAPNEVTTELVAYLDSFAYEVTVEDTDPNNPICHSSTVLIDAYTGELLEVMHCA